jgi:hypothetical protein
MKARRYIAVCLLAGGLAFGAGSAASWLLSRTASTTGGSGPVAAETLPELVTVTLDETVGSSGAARTIHVAKYEITVGAWDRCAADGGCSFTPRRRPYQSADHPVTGVNWRDVQQYVRWLSEATGWRLRLPREKEWDYLAKDVVEQKVEKLWDDPRLAWAADYASFGMREKKATEPVGHFSANRHGIHDLDGNVWEWTDTCWRNGASTKVDEAPVNCGGVRILAGKHKTWQSEFVRQVPLGGCSIGFPPSNLGFRIVLDDEPATMRHEILQTLIRALRIQSA